MFSNDFPNRIYQVMLNSCVSSNRGIRRIVNYVTDIETQQKIEQKINKAVNYLRETTLFEKPWLTTGAGDNEEIRSNEEIRLRQMKVGLTLLMGAMSVLFFLIFVAYIIRMEVADWQPLSEPGQLWTNTAFLVFSSITMQWAVIAARRDQTAGAIIGFLVAGLFAWAFLAGQLLAWQLLNKSGYFVANNPANSFFYMITALHGLHLLGGLGVWVYSLFKIGIGVGVTGLRSSVELCATYWHFLLGVWIILYSLLLLT